jgi:hypothetical protein
VVEISTFYAKCVSLDSPLGYNTTHDLAVPTLKELAFLLKSCLVILIPYSKFNVLSHF